VDGRTACLCCLACVIAATAAEKGRKSEHLTRTLKADVTSRVSGRRNVILSARNQRQLRLHLCVCIWSGVGGGGGWGVVLWHGMASRRD
jgi:hypothetical protein